MCYQLEIEPRDVMYFRDGRPIGASADGSGAAWPLPSIFHSALLSKLHAALGDQIAAHESNHKHLSKREEQNGNIRFQLGGLKTWGPFPSIGQEIFLPTPADLVAEPHADEKSCVSGGTLQPIESSTGCTNLPSPLRYTVASTLPPSKAMLGEWMSLAEYEKYLTGTGKGLQTVRSSELFASESRPGIAIDPASGATESGKFYSAEYLRLISNTQKQVSMRAFAECEARQYQQHSGKDMLAELFAASNNTAFVFGGQRGVAWLENKRVKAKSPMKMTMTMGCRLIKWTLLSPAYFAFGWRPGWINMPENGEKGFSEHHELGQVMLKEKIDRGSLSRDAWRKKIADAEYINAKLVAARIPKPIVASGWELDVNGVTAGTPKATKLYVPAGAVYYFECDNEIEAQKLALVLHGQTKSDFLGEQGLGLGVCSQWTLNKI